MPSLAVDLAVVCVPAPALTVLAGAVDAAMAEDAHELAGGDLSGERAAVVVRRT